MEGRSCHWWLEHSGQLDAAYRSQFIRGYRDVRRLQSHLHAAVPKRGLVLHTDQVLCRRRAIRNRAFDFAALNGPRRLLCRQ